jgi:GNAT superfamily N-acetyltransferase
MIEGPRAAREEELPAAVGLANAVFYPDGSVDMGRVLPTLFARSNLANLRVFVDDGRPVALTGMTVRDLSVDGVVIRAACVGSVCTRGDYRDRGLASRLMEDCIAAASARGASVILVSGGRGLYRRIGCIDAGLFRVIRMDRASRRPDVSCRVREWTESDLPDLQALHERERVRFMRAPGEMPALLRTRALRCRPARTWIVRVGKRTAAYLCVSDSCARELAGSRPAVLAAAPAILEASGEEQLELEIAASDAEMTSLASSFGLASRIAGMDGTLKIIDRPSFLAALSPRLPDALWIECGEAVELRAGTESMRVRSDEDRAALVFGSVERPPPEPGPGQLGEMLRGVFPVPLPAYGLNYI